MNFVKCEFRGLPFFHFIGRFSETGINLKKEP
jgi:hypothetical protein